MSTEVPEDRGQLHLEPGRRTLEFPLGVMQTHDRIQDTVIAIPLSTWTSVEIAEMFLAAGFIRVDAPIIYDETQPERSLQPSTIHGLYIETVVNEGATTALSLVGANYLPMYQTT